jgi:hypothetical protein
MLGEFLPLQISPPRKTWKELSDGDRILNFKFKPNSVSVTQFLPNLGLRVPTKNFGLPHARKAELMEPKRLMDRSLRIRRHISKRTA